MNIASNVYRVTNVNYDTNLDLNFSSLEMLKGSSIWLIDDSYLGSFYEHNPSVEKIVINKKLPKTLLVRIDVSDKLAYIQDNRQSPPRTFILHKNLYNNEKGNSEGLLLLKINNGPIKEGFFEEVVTFVMTLKKYPINLANIQVNFDGEGIKVIHFKSEFDLGSPYDLGRKAAVVGYYISENPCVGEIRLVYSENGQEIRAVTNCQ